MKRFVKLLVITVHAFFALAVTTLLLICGFSTTKITRAEVALFVRDSIWGNVLAAAAFAVLMICLYFLLDKETARLSKIRRYVNHISVQKACGYATIGLGLLLILSTQFYPRADAWSVMEAAKALRNKENEMFLPGGYISMHQNQAGLVVLSYFLYSIVGESNFLAVQIINVIALWGIQRATLKIESELELPERVKTITAIVGVSFVPFLLYVNFVYGNLMGLALSLMATQHEIRYFKTKRVIDLLGCSLMIALAVTIKNNYSIFMIGLVLYALLELLQNKEKRALALIVVTIAFCTVALKLPIGFIEQRIGNDLGDGCSSVSFVAMGLQESPRSAGWWNYYPRTSFAECDYDGERQAALAKENIKESLQEFWENKTYAIDFFSRKITSQWADPTFQGWWIQNQVTNQPQSDVATAFLSPWIAERISIYLNLLQFVVLIGSALYVFPLFVGKMGKFFAFELIFVGGFVFHLFWEAKGQYTLPYFALLIPLAIATYGKMAERVVVCMKGAELQNTSPQDKIGKKCAACGLTFIIFIGLLSVAEPHAKIFFHREADTELYSQYIFLQRNDFNVRSRAIKIKNSDTPQYLEQTESNDLVLGAEGQTVQVQEHGSYCELQFTDSKMYFDVYSGKMTENQRVWAYKGNHTAAQRWRLVAVPGEKYTVYITIGDDSVLTYDNERGITVIRAFTGSEDQKWIIEEI